MKRPLEIAPQQIKVITGDDHSVIRHGLRSIFKSQNDLRAVAEAADGEETCQLCDQHEYLQAEIREIFDFGEIVGQSSALKKALHQIQLVAGTNSTVLILGESGTGKELIARAVHERSPRKQRPFIKVNCAAVPDKLFESEFFGHVKRKRALLIARPLGSYTVSECSSEFA